VQGKLQADCRLGFAAQGFEAGYSPHSRFNAGIFDSSAITLKGIRKSTKLWVEITNFRRGYLNPIERDLAMVDRAGFKPR
jgi:hypothetical protein